MAALITQSQDKYPWPTPSLAQTRVLICPLGVCCGLPGLLSMGGLTADKDFGKGGSLAVGVLDLHRVGGCILNGASEKREGDVSLRLLGSTENSLPESRVGGEGGGYGRTLGSRSGPAPEKLGAFGLPLSLSTPPGPPLKNGENITRRLKVKAL